jgi:thiol-disulfide isomerase/thioredoxin
MTQGVEGIEVEVSCQIGAGCMYDPIKNIVPINGGEPVTLEHKAGEVWLVDFWATWCPPCQAPMQHNEDMLKKRAADWGDKVKIIGISIDNTAEAVVNHVNAKGWNSPIHYHRAGSDCSQQYGVKGVPNVMIIDTTGKIVYKGHPATRPDLEADFDTLLKGEAITGAGTEAEAPAGGDAAGGDDGKEMDFDAHNAVIDKFASEIGPALQADETIKASAAKMQRAFCVFVL